jgi:hypothetical protein
MLPRFGLSRLDAITRGRHGVLGTGQAIEPLDDPAQAIKVEQMLCGHCGRNLRIRAVVGTAQRDGGVTTVREHDDKVRIVAAAKTNDLDALAPKGMMRMGDGDKSRRRSG